MPQESEENITARKLIQINSNNLGIKCLYSPFYWNSISSVTPGLLCNKSSPEQRRQHNTTPGCNSCIGNKYLQFYFRTKKTRIRVDECRFVQYPQKRNLNTNLAPGLVMQWDADDAAVTQNWQCDWINIK